MARTKREEDKAMRDRARRAAIQHRKVAHRFTHPHPTAQTTDRNNITIVSREEGRTILQRLSPSSSTKITEMNHAVAEGTQLMHALFQRMGELGERHGSQTCHLGMWYNMHVQNGWTRENDKYKPESTKMLGWISAFFFKFVRPLQSLMEKDFVDALENRVDGFNWLKEMMPDGHCDLLHHWWMMAAAIKGHTVKYHKDTRDAQPTILVNLGGRVKLFIKDSLGHSAVYLHPGNVALFDATMSHKVKPARGGLMRRKIGDLPLVFQ